MKAGLHVMPFPIIERLWFRRVSNSADRGMCSATVDVWFYGLLLTLLCLHCKRPVHITGEH